MLSLSSIAGTQHAIDFLGLEAHLMHLNLPKLKGPSCVFRSSFSYAYTIEVLFPDCEAGQPSETVFHEFYQQISKEATPPEHNHMQVETPIPFAIALIR